MAYLRDMKSLTPLLPVEKQNTHLNSEIDMVQLSGEINIGADGKAMAIVSPRLRMLFSGIPIGGVTLHAVLTNDDPGGKLPIKFTPVVSAGSAVLDSMPYTNKELNDASLDVDTVVYDYDQDTNPLKYRLQKALNVRELTLQGSSPSGAVKDFSNFLKTNPTAKNFVSIKLNGPCSGETAKVLQRYDTSSPWCFPARFTKKISGGYSIHISFRELPDFNKMKKFAEFDLGDSNAK